MVLTLVHLFESYNRLFIIDAAIEIATEEEGTLDSSRVQLVDYFRLVLPRAIIEGEGNCFWSCAFILDSGKRVFLQFRGV